MLVSAVVPAAADEGLTAPTVTVVARGREDIDPDSPRNPYRVSESSRLASQTLTAADIEAFKPRDLFDLLDHAVGVHTMFQGRKVPFTVRIRGDTHFAFLIDGVYVPQNSAGRILQTLPVDAIEQVEIVRDATALGLGTLVNVVSASGAPNDGFIVIRTRRPSGPQAGARMSAGRFGTMAAGLHAGTATPAGYVDLRGSRYDTDGRADQHMAQDSTSALATLGFGNHRFAVDTTIFRDRTHLQIQAADPAVSTLWPQRWQLSPLDTTLASARFTAAWDARHTTLLSLGRSHVTATQYQGSVLVPDPNIIPNEETIDTLDLKHTFRTGPALVRAGVQWLHWITPTGQMFYEGVPREERLFGCFVQAERTFFSGRLTIDAAVRRDEQNVVRGVDRYEPVPVRGTLQTFTDRRLPPSDFFAFGLAASPLDRWRFTGRYYRARQGGVSGVLSAGNLPLDPENQHKAEFGVSHAGWPAFEPTLTLFDSRIDNAKAPVEYVITGGVARALYGQRDVHRSGAELQAQGRLPRRTGVLTYRVGWTHLIGVEELVDQGRSAPRNVLTGSLRYETGPWDAGISATQVGRYVSNFQAVDAASHPIGDYTRLDINVSRAVRFGTREFRTTVFGRNVTDRRYQTQLGFPDPGAIWGVEFTLEL
ncbi:MAG: TonB-dependent receptor [Betaproteobacteria bacterium]|nr:TonB-dependent receptor [Betaproteobacteria bacterium]